MSDTPRTDALAHECLDGDLNGVMVVSVLFARQLERELDSSNTVSATLLATKCRELAEVTKQRDELLGALKDYIDNGHSKALQERAKIIVDKAKGGDK